jgi:carboxylesterase type B
LEIGVILYVGATMSASHTSHRHPSLGPITGIVRTPAVVQFRNVPFARIPGRFRQSVLVDTLTPAQRDCTVDGYGCPQIPQTSAAVGGPLKGEPVYQYNEFDCLTLVISTPKQALDDVSNSGQSHKLLPVMVYVHGGAFSESLHIKALHGMSLILKKI